MFDVQIMLGLVNVRFYFARAWGYMFGLRLVFKVKDTMLVIS
jgi:hypothetical protein